MTGEVPRRARAVGPLDGVNAELEERSAVEDASVDDALAQVLDLGRRRGPGVVALGRPVGRQVAAQAAAVAGA
jgi:hypothetical protein